MTVSFTGATTRATSTALYHPSLLDDLIIEATYSATVMAPLVYQKNLAGSPTNTARFPRWPALTAVAVAETSDLANTAIASTAIEVAVGEVGITAAFSDALDEDDIVEIGRYADQLGRAVADKLDSDLAALLTGHSNATGVTAGGLTLSTFQTAAWNLAGRDAPKPYVAVLSTRQAGQLAKDISANGGNIMTNRADREFPAGSGYWATLFDTDIFVTTNVPTGTRATVATDEGAIFSRGRAHGLVTKRMARTEFERDASARLTEVTVTARYGVGELVDAWGETLYSNQA